MKLCIDCKHFEPAPSIKWYGLLFRPDPGQFQDKCNNVGPDLVTGEPRQADAQWMRNGELHS